MTAAPGPSKQKTQYAMGTLMAHSAFGAEAEPAVDAVCWMVDRLERLMSRFLPGSDISRINLSAGISPEKVSEETFEVLAKSVEYSRKFSGIFDITIEPLVNLWNKAKETLAPPDKEQIQLILPLVNWRDLHLDPWEMTAFLSRFGSGIDLGGIGKGYAADRVRDIYQQYGITSAFSNLGGNVITLGTKPGGSFWQIGIQHPRDDSLLVGSLAIKDKVVVTAGDYQRCFMDRNGLRHHHILNPKTGSPADSGLASVTLVADNGMTADALSTILFSAGKEQALEILQAFPSIEAVMVDTDMNVIVTAGLRDQFQPVPGIEVAFAG